MMKQLLVKLLVSAILLVTLAQAKDNYAERKMVVRGIFTGSGARSSAKAPCTQSSCKNGFICKHKSCIVPKGKSCKSKIVSSSFINKMWVLNVSLTA
jgi:hypothetical protein